MFRVGLVFILLLLFSIHMNAQFDSDSGNVLKYKTLKGLSASAKERDSILRNKKLAVILTQRFPERSRVDGRWVYFEETANVREMFLPSISKIIPSYKIFKVALTNYLGYHINRSYNLFLLDTVTEALIHAEPLWYSDKNEKMIKLFLGKRFNDTASLMNFVKDFQKLLGVGTTGSFTPATLVDSKLTFDIVYGTSSDPEIWRHYEILIDDYQIVEFRSTNPVSGEVYSVQANSIKK